MPCDCCRPRNRCMQQHPALHLDFGDALRRSFPCQVQFRALEPALHPDFGDALRQGVCGVVGLDLDPALHPDFGDALRQPSKKPLAFHAVGSPFARAPDLAAEEEPLQMGTTFDFDGRLPSERSLDWTLCRSARALSFRMPPGREPPAVGVCLSKRRELAALSCGGASLGLPPPSSRLPAPPPP